MVIAYEMVKRGFDRGRAQGVVEGRAQERVNIKRKLADYERRRQKAHARGEDFNEPLPTFDEEEEEQEQR